MSDTDTDGDDEDDTHAVVIDNGSSKIAAGICSRDAPSIVYEYISNLPESKPSPVTRGVISDFEEMENIWRNAVFKQLKSLPEEHSVLLTECALNEKTSREMMTKVMFESFNVPAMYVAIDAVLGLYASGRTTGTVVDFGYEKVQTVPIYEGYSLPHAILKSRFGGKHCIEYLQKLLLQSHEHIVSAIPFKDAKLMLEKWAYVALEYEAEMKKRFCDVQHIISGFLRCIDETRYGYFASVDIEDLCMKYSQHFVDEMPIDQLKTYRLPDGTQLKVGQERASCAEVLFRPSLIGSEEQGIPQQLYASNIKTDIDLRRFKWSNIVVMGAPSLLPGMHDRFHKEITALAPASMRIHVVAPPERKYSAWIGGSILSSLSTFPEMWITKDEYDEAGPGIVHRKCF